MGCFHSQPRDAKHDVGHQTPSQIQPSVRISDMDDAALARLVDSIIEETGPDVGAFQAHEATQDHAERENDIQRQWLMASLRRGHFSNEAVAVDISRRLDVEYGNPGPEISMEQQLTNTGLLSSDNAEEISFTRKQQRYRGLCIFPRESFAPELEEELKALEQDDDVHSVSVISCKHDEDPANYRHCSIDCWLKASHEDPGHISLTLEALSTPHKIIGPDVSGTYDYEVLESNTTRLLNLHPGNLGDQIVCDLSIVGIANSTSGGDSPSKILPPYEALSYTWGDPTPVFTIKINKGLVPVAQNLFFALQYLRHETETRHLWIDAICINQQDLDERSAQVVHMLQIYKNASKVIVWLGVESEDSHLAMTSMKYLDEKKQREEVTLRSHDEACYDHLKRLYEAQCRLFERPWFHRSWIRQEVMVAKDITVVCGHDEVRWYLMKRSAARLSRLYTKMTKEDISGVAQLSNDHSTAVACLTTAWIYGQPVTKLIGSIRSIWYHHSGGLLDLLMASREYEATDARDKVYSVLGLARVPMTTKTETPSPDLGAAAFPVDYSKLVSEVYQDLVKYMINRDQNLDILSILLAHRNAASNEDLPSWAPDWRVPVSEIPVSSHWDFISHKVAAGGFRVKALPQSYDEKNILRAQGYLVDTIQQMDDYSASVYNILSTLPGYSDDEDYEGNADQRPERRLYAEPFDPQKHRTRCCTVSSGGICLAPTATRPGDSVVILLGGKHPFILRPTAEEVVGRENAVSTVRAAVIGPCIVPQAMFGKLVKLASERSIPPTDFILV